MRKVLFKNEAVRIEARGNRLMVVAYSMYEGETKTYYMTENKDFNKQTDFTSSWNETTDTWEALLHAIRQQGVNITSVKDYAVK